MSNIIVNVKNYPKAFSEINTILNYFPQEYIKKIPQSFINFLKQNMDKFHTININSLEECLEYPLLHETNVLLSLIYRSYFCTPEEKKRLEEKDFEDMKNLQEKYSPENLFKNNNSEIIPNKETSLIEIENKEKWFIILKNKIITFFQKLKKK